MNEIITTTKNAVAENITNPHLRLATRRIYNIGEKIRRCSLEVASIVASVEDTKTYKDDFKKSSEWAEKVFGFKRSTFFNMLKIGREWVQVESRNTAGRTMCHEYHTVLTKSGEDDYSVSQLTILFPLGVPAAVELHEHGVIQPNMSVRRLKEVVEDYLKDDVEEETNETEAPEEVDEAETEEVKEAEVEVVEEYQHSATVKIVPTEGTVTVIVGEIVYTFSLEEWAAHTNAEKTFFPAKR